MENGGEKGWEQVLDLSTKQQSQPGKRERERGEGRGDEIKKERPPHPPDRTFKCYSWRTRDGQVGWTDEWKAIYSLRNQKQVRRGSRGNRRGDFSFCVCAMSRKETKLGDISQPSFVETTFPSLSLSLSVSHNQFQFRKEATYFFFPLLYRFRQTRLISQPQHRGRERQTLEA